MRKLQNWFTKQCIKNTFKYTHCIPKHRAQDIKKDFWKSLKGSLSHMSGTRHCRRIIALHWPDIGAIQSWYCSWLIWLDPSCKIGAQSQTTPFTDFTAAQSCGAWPYSTKSAQLSPVGGFWRIKKHLSTNRQNVFVDRFLSDTTETICLADWERFYRSFHKRHLIYRAAFNDKKGRAIKLIFGLLRGLHA